MKNYELMMMREISYGSRRNLIANKPCISVGTPFLEDMQ